jgi:hypothetical protein
MTGTPVGSHPALRHRHSLRCPRMQPSLHGLHVPTKKPDRQLGFRANRFLGQGGDNGRKKGFLKIRASPLWSFQPFGSQCLRRTQSFARHGRPYSHCDRIGDVPRGQNYVFHPTAPADFSAIRCFPSNLTASHYGPLPYSVQLRPAFHSDRVDRPAMNSPGWCDWPCQAAALSPFSIPSASCASERSQN